MGEMDKKRVIAYGLGRLWKKNRKKIEHQYEVVGVSDSNEEYKKEYSSFIPKKDIKDTCIDVLICIAWPNLVEVINELLENYGVAEERIMVWQTENDLFLQRKVVKPNFRAYSQFGEDYVIHKLLEEKGIMDKDASYIELGVFNPTRDNNTYFLHLSGAKGILVDANKEYIPTIRIIRKGSVVLNKAVVENSNRQPIVDFYVTEDGGTSSVDINSIEEHKTVIKKKVEMETITINECLNMLDKNCDVLSVDLEGLDEKILYSLDFKAFQPKIICAETRNQCDELVKYICDKGYKYVFSNGVNDIWSRKE